MAMKVSGATASRLVLILTTCSSDSIALRPSPTAAYNLAIFDNVGTNLSLSGPKMNRSLFKTCSNHLTADTKSDCASQILAITDIAEDREGSFFPDDF